MVVVVEALKRYWQYENGGEPRSRLSVESGETRLEGLALSRVLE